MEFIIVDSTDQFPSTDGVLEHPQEPGFRLPLFRDEHLVAAVHRTEPHQFTVLLHLSGEADLEHIDLLNQPVGLVERVELREVNARVFFLQRLQLLDRFE